MTKVVLHPPTMKNVYKMLSQKNNLLYNHTIVGLPRTAPAGTSSSVPAYKQR